MTKEIVVKKEQVIADFLAELRAASVETKFALSQSVLRLLHHTAQSLVQVRELLHGQVSQEELIGMAAKEIGFSERYVYRAIELLEYVPDVENLPKGFDNKTVSFSKLCSHFLGHEEKPTRKKKSVECPFCKKTFDI